MGWMLSPRGTEEQRASREPWESREVECRPESGPRGSIPRRVKRQPSLRFPEQRLQSHPVESAGAPCSKCRGSWGSLAEWLGEGCVICDNRAFLHDSGG